MDLSYNQLFAQDDILNEQSDLEENDRQQHERDVDAEEKDREEEDDEKEQRDVVEQEESDHIGDLVASPLRSRGVDGERGTQVGPIDFSQNLF